MSRLRRRSRAAVIAAAAVCAIACPARAAAGVVYVYPSPGSRVAPPGAQIVFRGVAVSRIGRVSVVGSRSGVHAGRVLGDSDGRGGSFIPIRPFAPGETVTVRTRLHVAGGRRGAFDFDVADPAPLAALGALSRALAPSTSGDVLRFRSLPGFAPEAVRVLVRTAEATPDDIFVAPQGGPGQRGAMIVGPDGSLVWFKPAPAGQWTHNFQAQEYRGQPVLTWWQGHIVEGFGQGEDVIYNASYQPVTTVRGLDGLSADLHEFELTPQGTALITAYDPVYWTVPAAGGARRIVVLDGVVQEIDLATGLLLFEWHSLDHVGLQESYAGTPDYFHLNAVQQTPDGNLLISARNTWAGYLVGHGLGRVLWRLGGKRSSFRLGPGAGFAFQHDMRLHASGLVTLYDDGARASSTQLQSRGLTLALDTRRMTARLVAADRHTPPVLAYYEGNDELLSNGHSFVGWGGSPFFTEFDASGRIVFDARFVANLADYRAFLEPWNGNPADPPAVAATPSGTATTVYASWNGTTQTSSWRVLVGADPSSLLPVATAARQGFETPITVPGQYPYVAVQALGAAGQVLGTSAAVQPH